MRDSRLFLLLEPLPSEAVVYLWSTGEAGARSRVEHFLDDLAHLRPAVTGNDLVALGLEPGPGFSAILSQARADRLDGRAIGRDAELANLRRLAARARQA
jgi:tRNA nucleotidyltransferase (CCA-adding enzyme)